MSNKEGMNIDDVVLAMVTQLKESGEMPEAAEVKHVRTLRTGRTMKLIVEMTIGPPIEFEATLPLDG